MLRIVEDVIYDYSSGIDFGVKLGCFLATILIQLNGWTSNSAIATKDATVSLFWFQYLFTAFALIEVLARICGHYFFFLVSTVWASDGGF
jgi:hypothetical protein